MSVGEFATVVSRQHFVGLSGGSVIDVVHVPPRSEVDVYAAVTYAPMSAEFVVLWRVHGRTRFGVRRGHTTHETRADEGIGHIVQAMQDELVSQRVVQVDADTADVECGGTFSGNLFRQFVVVKSNPKPIP